MKTSKRILKAAIATGAIVLASHTNTSIAESIEGAVDFRTRVAVEALRRGTVVDVPVAVGDLVPAGNIVVEFDSTWQKARVRKRKSIIERLNVKMESVQAKFDRQQELYDRGSLSLLAYEETENELSVVRFELVEAEAELAVANYRLDQTKLKAPFDSIVVERNIQPGMNVRTDDRLRPLMTLAMIGEYVVRARVSFATRQTIKAGDPAVVTVNDQEYRAQVELSTLDPVQTDQGTMFLVDLVFQSPEQMIIPGTPAIVAFE